MARKGYVQLSNGFYLNRKIRKLRATCPGAVGAFAMLISYCGDNLTDGHVDGDTLRYVLGVTDEETDALHAAGMLEPDGDGWIVHDFLSHNRSKEQVFAKRKRERERYSNGKNPDPAHSLPADCRVSAGRNETESGQTPEHQNTRTPHTEESENKFSSSSVCVRARERKNQARPRTALDRWAPSPTATALACELGMDADWEAAKFRDHVLEGGSLPADLDAGFRNWLRSGHDLGIPSHPPKPPPSRHRHTWACSHVLKELGRTEETAQPDEIATKTAARLNRGGTNEEDHA